MNKAEEFEKLLNVYIKNEKINKVLERIQDYTDDSRIIPMSNLQNIVQALLNISDNLPKNEIGFFGIEPDIEIHRIIFQLFRRDNNKDKYYKILKETIPLSNSVLGPVQEISLVSPSDDNEKKRKPFLDIDKLLELQKLCIEKIKSLKTEELLRNKGFLYILFRLKEWGEKRDWKQIISDIKSNEKLFWLFLNTFISESRRQTIGDYGYKIHKQIDHESLKIFFDSNEIKQRIKEAKNNPKTYNKYKEVIDLFLEL